MNQKVTSSEQLLNHPGYELLDLGMDVDSTDHLYSIIFIGSNVPIAKHALNHEGIELLLGELRTKV